MPEPVDIQRQDVNQWPRRKKHYAGESSNRASCEVRLALDSPRVTNNEEFWAADADGTLCQRRRKAATNEASPYQSLCVLLNIHRP